MGAIRVSDYHPREIPTLIPKDMKHTLLILTAVSSMLLTTACGSIASTGKVAGRTQATATSAAVASASDNTVAAGVAKVQPVADIEGEWTIVKVNDRMIPADDQMPYITFESTDSTSGRFYCSNGCNILNGNYRLTSGDILSTSSVAATMKYCPEIDYDSSISALLGGELSPKITVSTIGHETYLTIKGNDLSLSARRHNMDFLNGQWQIVQLNGKAVNDEEANIFIDINELKIHGNTGCNYFNGNIYIDPQQSNAIDFGNMGLTRMACPKYDQEQAMMLALEQTTTAIKGNHGRVLFLDAQGTPLIELRKQSTPTE